ncbi:uncharacterized protein LOC126840049 [Adelges cooleyi]|uniref:uncharacterized protein LOC126840049 n=1 Tax=Adelges cooleyi TaxID=133065 RepID=UPI00217FD92A|nr:uncharacterized protein LOC126840049 [Adelges cooleyi]
MLRKELQSNYTDWKTNRRITLPSVETNELWCFVLRLLQNYLCFVEEQLKNNENPPNLYENLCNVTKLLYSHFLFNFLEALRCFGYLVVKQVLECYVQILSIVCSNRVYLNDLDKFISDCYAHFLVYDKQVELFSVLNNTISYLDDLISCNQLKNISLIESIEYQLIKCISIIGFSIENDSAKLQNVLTKLTKVAEQHSFVDKNNANTFLITTLKLCCAFQNHKDNMNMLAGWAQSSSKLIGRIDGKSTDFNMKCLKLKTVFNNSTLSMELCKCLREEIKHISWSLSKLEAEKKVSTSATVCPLKQNKTFVQDHLETVETIIQQTIKAMSIANYFVQSKKIPLGQMTEFLFETVCDLINAINGIIKLFHDCSTAEDPTYKTTSLSTVNNMLLHFYHLL